MPLSNMVVGWHASISVSAAQGLQFRALDVDLDDVDLATIDERVEPGEANVYALDRARQRARSASCNRTARHQRRRS
jgi:hypothetical protein